MAKSPSSSLLPLIAAAAVVAALGGLVFRKVRTERAAPSSNPARPLDDKAKEWISDVVATPRR